jgi:hypothetical protein
MACEVETKIYDYELYAGLCYSDHCLRGNRSDTLRQYANLHVYHYIDIALMTFFFEDFILTQRNDNYGNRSTDGRKIDGNWPPHNPELKVNTFAGSASCTPMLARDQPGLEAYEILRNKCLLSRTTVQNHSHATVYLLLLRGSSPQTGSALDRAEPMQCTQCLHASIRLWH